MLGETYDWKRFWCPRGGSLNLQDGGYLVDPDGTLGRRWNADLRTFDAIADLPCLVMLGEPGMGKTSTMRSERRAIDTSVQAGGGDTLWLDLRSCGSEYQIVRKLFESEKFESWSAGDHHLHVFLDSLDECRLRVDNVAALLADELMEVPVGRLSLRIGCRTAEWPKTLEDGLKALWSEESIGVYELAPLRRVDVATAATANGLEPDTFLRGVQEAEAAPLAIKPVTLGFLLESYGKSGGLPSRQVELYLDGCRRLCEERNEDRVEAGRTGELSADQRLAVAARIAAVTTFSNKYAVWTGLERANLREDDVLVRGLAGGTEAVGGDEFAVGEEAVKEALATGLFSARGPERLGWAHQTYAEFLAARYLAQRGLGMEQTMSLISHPDDLQGKLVPQLHETAAWLASMSPEVFRKIADTDPEVLLRSDVASTDVDDKVALVDTLLRLYDEGKLPDAGTIPHSQYRKLEHPGLADQLEPYIADAGKDLVARTAALDIAEACELRSLQGVAVEVALDADQPFLVRKDAVRFVAHVGDGHTRGRLKPLAVGAAGDDPDGDLRGWALEAVWPEHMSAEELFGALARPNDNYLGSYAFFLLNELPESLRPADLPVALSWVEDQQRRHDMSYRLADLMDQIMLQAWDCLDAPGVREAFAGAALARLRQYDEIVRERPSSFGTTEEPPFSDRVAADDAKRRGLMEKMVELLQAEDDEAWMLVHYKTPLLLGKDAAWLIGKLEAETSDRKRQILAALLRRAFYHWDNEQHEIVYLAYERNPALADEVGRFFDAVDLSSEEARKQREYHEEANNWRQEREERPSPDPPMAERIVRALDDFEAGDVDAFWQRLYYFLQFDASGFARVSGIEWDVTALPGWQVADAATRSRIVEAAKRYILEGKPNTDEWLGKGVIYPQAFAGYRALRLLQNLSPDSLSDIPEHAWERWAPMILDFPISTGTGEGEPHLELVATAYRRAPGAFIDTLLFLLKKENEEKGHLFILHDLKRCWDDRLAGILLEQAKDPRMKPPCVEHLLKDLLDYELGEAEEFAKTLVDSWSGADEDGRARAIAAAEALVFHTGDAGWPVVWAAMQRNDEFAGELVGAIANGAHHSDLSSKRLSERQAADLYIWLVRRYPHSEYYIQYREDSLADIGFRESVSMWRDDIPRDLQNRGTPEACRQIERIMAELPELQDRLKWTLHHARAETRRKTWAAPRPEYVLSLARGRTTRLVQNGDQLLEALIESLGRLQNRLQGETPAVFALWNEAGGSYTPKDEERLSDEIKLHLEQDLAGRGVVVNREVVIRRGGGGRRGERTDIHVDAAVPGSDQDQYDTVSAIIETKGCWNRELGMAMEDQLVNRYLQDNECRHGLYVVGWFNCQQWDDVDQRKVRAPRHSIDVARERFEDQASRLSQGGLLVRSVVLDTSLR